MISKREIWGHVENVIQKYDASQRGAVGPGLRVYLRKLERAEEPLQLPSEEGAERPKKGGRRSVSTARSRAACSHNIPIREKLRGRDGHRGIVSESKLN